MSSRMEREPECSTHSWMALPRGSPSAAEPRRALGGIGVSKSSPTFDLGMIGNIISGLIGGGVARPDRYVIAPGGHGGGAVGQSERRRRHLTGDRRRRWRRILTV